MLLCILVQVHTTAQSVPYVYNVENTGSAYPAPPLPPLGSLPRIEMLPDPFAWANDPMGSTRSTAFNDWSHHRAEIKAQIEHYEIGTKPAVDQSQVTATYSGGTLTVRVTVNGKTLTLTSAVSLPSGSGPFPVVIGMNSASGSLPSNAFTSRNIARITYSHDQVTTYNNPSNSNPYYQLYPNLNIDNTGQYSAWAWGVSRIIDGLYKLQGTLPIDVSRIAVTGCSYAGKMALFAGAFDERIALTIAQESGGGGAPSWRYSQTESSGSVEGLGQTSHQWFKEDMFQFAGNNVSYLPEDHHMLMAMCAPRALFVTGNTNYTWLSNPSCYVSARATKQIFTTLGIADRFGFAITGGHSHCSFPSSLDADLGYFLDKFLKGNTSLTRNVQVYPSNYSSIDYGRWYSWWGTNGSNTPPVANAGADQNVTDSDNNGSQSVTLNGSGSSDPDGTISSYIWKEGSTQIATGATPSVNFTVGNHTVTLTVTDNDGASASDNVVITVTAGGGQNNPPVANAGNDQTVTDTDNNGSQSVSLNGSGSSDSDGTIASYVWREGTTQIATGISPQVNLTVGTHTLTLTVTDDDGATGTDNVVITVNAGGTGSTSVWLEAECGTVGSLWNVTNDANASNGQYVSIRSGNNSTSAAPSSSTGHIIYTFNVSASGTYTLWARIIAPNANDDSFWVRMDNGSWFNWNNITSSSSWVWDDCQSYSLSSGSHTLTIAYREDGARLDKIYISNSGSTPSGQGSAATNCSTGGSYSITVRARGTSGSEQIRLTVGGSTVQTWTLTTSMSNYTASTANAGAINVEFINDGTNRDVQVDYIQVAGTTRQAEQQATNTGVWQNSKCGGSNSEWLHCNGYIAFAAYKSSEEVSEELTEADDMFVYPNPANDKLFLTLPDQQTELVTVRLYSSTGMLISIQTLESRNPVIDINNLEKGFYFITVNINNATYTSRFFKM